MEKDVRQRLAESVLARILIPMEASARHVHITRDQCRTLFGHDLTPQRELSQPGQYLARERVTVKGPAGEFQNVAVLGPPRAEAQIEISLTDARTLGLQPPLRLSGDVEGSPGAELRGPRGSVTLPKGVIAARRHIHMTPEDAARMGVADGQTVRLETYTDRPLVFDDVAVRVSPRFATFAHLDYDEANACAMKPGDLGRLIP